MAGTGADSTMAASSAATVAWAKRARTGRPSRSATERSAMSMAAAPSVIWEAFPAVMSGAVSGSQLCAGGRPARASSEALRRMPSSASRDWPVKVPSSALTGTATASAAKWPESHEATARRWLSKAYSSISSRLTPHRSASTWATRNWAHSRPSMASRNDGGKGPVPPRALEAMGARLIDSTPQATTRS